MAKTRNTIKNNPLDKSSAGLLDDITGTASSPGIPRRGRPPGGGRKTRIFNMRMPVELHQALTRAAMWTTPKTTMQAIVERAVMRELEKMEREYEKLMGKGWPE